MLCELLGRRERLILAVPAELRLSRHDADPAGSCERGQDPAPPGMRDGETCLGEHLVMPRLQQAHRCLEIAREERYRVSGPKNGVHRLVPGERFAIRLRLAPDPNERRPKLFPGTDRVDLDKRITLGVEARLRVSSIKKTHILQSLVPMSLFRSDPAAATGPGIFRRCPMSQMFGLFIRQAGEPCHQLRRHLIRQDNHEALYRIVA